MFDFLLSVSKGRASLLLIALAIFGLTACEVPQTEKKPPNILLIIGDDMGVETLAAYGLIEDPPKTAALDQLAEEGVRFDNFWSQPVCTPTRATLMTGRYGFRTGLGRALMGVPQMPELLPKPEGSSTEPARTRFSRQVDPDERPAYLLADEFTLPMALKADEDLGYNTAAIGKWHLGDVPNGWLDHPNLAGFDHFAGQMEGVTFSFFSWNKVINGEVSSEVGYTPTQKVDDAISWLDRQESKPWFMWLAFNLPHPPLHVPPENLWQSDHSQLDPMGDPREDSLEKFDAMIEAMDSEIGRLLASLDQETRDNTYVIFMGDNGTVPNLIREPFQRDKAKNTVYQGGVNVPLLVSGPGVIQGIASDALVNSTDLFATILQMAGIEMTEVVPEGVTTDSVSFLPALSNPDTASEREWVYVDAFRNSASGRDEADYAMRDVRFKLLRFQGEVEFYDLQQDPYERNNLLAGELSVDQQSAYERLQTQLAQLRESE
jgi:arylsulfatase A-like enzyme